MVVRLRYEKGLNDKARDKITHLAQTYGLLDAEGNQTLKYLALMDDEIEKPAGELLAGLLRLTRILRIDENLRLIVDHVRDKAEAILVEGTTSATGGFW